MARDELFEALATVCGWDWRDLTRSSRGRLNQALMELREVGATPEDITACARAYRAKYETATLTPQALVANWPDLKAWVRGYGPSRYDPQQSMQRAIEIAELPEYASEGEEVGDEAHRDVDGGGEG